MKKALSLILALFMIMGTLPAMSLLSVAEDIPVAGTWTRGDTGADVTGTLTDGSTGGYVDISWQNPSNRYNVYYTLESGILTVYGTGELSGSASAFPWYGERSTITKVVIAPGFTSIGSGGIFAHYDALREVVIGEGVTSIGGDAFAYNGALTTITLPSTLTTLSQGVVYASNNISTVYVAPGWTNANLTSVGAYNGNITDKTHVEMTYTPFDCGVWGSENWAGSPNKGDAESVFQFLVYIRDMNGNDLIPWSQTNNYDWYLTISSANFGKRIKMAPATSYAAMRRFEVCLGEGDNQFIPIKGLSYTIQVDICDKTTGDVLYRSDAQSGFNVGVDPVVPQDNGTVYFVNGSCYVEGDLGSEMAIKSINLAHYVDSTRYYKWRAYATNDNTAPISQWTYIGGKMTDEASTAEGYTAAMTVNSEYSYDAYRYVRIYGVYDSANSGYHFSEASFVTYSATLSHLITFNVDGAAYTTLCDDGEIPVCPVSTDKAPDYTVAYTFTGWDTPLAAATGPATYTAQYASSVRSPRAVTLEGWGGFENWSNNTQLLFQINGTESDFATEVSRLKTNNFGNFRWKFTISHEENGETVTEVHNMVPWSTITADNNFRFKPADQADAFIPETGVTYTIGVDVYDMTLTDEFGAAGYLLYTTGSYTKNYTFGVSELQYNGSAVTADDFYTITWTLDGETVGTTNVLPGKTPTYPGDPLPTEKTEDGVNYILSAPSIAAASADATYAYRYVRADGKVTVSWVDATNSANNYSAEYSVGDTATYAGAAAEYTGADGYTLYTPVIEGNGSTVTEDATYQITWTSKDTRMLGIGKYSTGIENWPPANPQTQFLVVLSKDGGDFKVTVSDYDWVITIDGTDYNLAPSSTSGLWGTGYLYRFTPAANETFVPQAGAGSYVVSVKLYNKGTDTLAYYTDGTVTMTSPADFVPVHAHSYADEVTTPATCTEAGVRTYTCSVCGHVYTEEIEAAGHTFGDWSYNGTVTFAAGTTKTRTCTECGATETEDVAKAELGVYENVIQTVKDGKKCVAVVTTIKAENIDFECIDYVAVTLQFSQGDEVVKTVTQKVHNIYKTVTGIATTGESVSASQGSVYIENVDYLFAINMKGVPEGDYTLTATVEAVDGGSAIDGATATGTIAFTVA